MRAYRWLVWWVALSVVALAVFAVARPEIQVLMWPVFSLGGAAAMAAGIRINPRQRPWPVYFFVATLCLIGTGDVILVVGGFGLTPIASVFYSLAYLVLGVSIVAMMRVRIPHGERAGAIDALIVMVATAAVLWDLIVSPALATQVDLFERVWVVASPLIAAAVFAGMMRILLADATHLWSAWLMLAGMCTTVVGNLLLLGGYQGNPHSFVLMMLWNCSYILVAAAQLHPDVRTLHQPVSETSARMSYGRLVVVGVSLIALPVTMLRTRQLDPDGPPVAIIAAALCVGLVLWRLGLLLAERERSWRELQRWAQRESALAAISEAAVGSNTVAELLEGAERAIGDVVSADRVHVSLYEPHTPDRGPPPHLPAHQPSIAELSGWRGEVLVDLVGERAPDVGEADFVNAARNLLFSAVQRRKAEEEMRHQTLHDMLTGLPNRSLFLDRLGHSLARMRRDGGSVAVLFIDLDGFKAVNDSYGHAAGDCVLVETATRLRTMLRPGDTVARFSGDEFVVLCESATADQGQVVAGRILADLSRAQQLAHGSNRVAGAAGTGTVCVSASIGVAQASADDNSEAVLRRADAAMYRAKHAGRGRVETDDGVASKSEPIECDANV